jgi:hypothetical protein
LAVIPPGVDATNEQDRATFDAATQPVGRRGWDGLFLAASAGTPRSTAVSSVRRVG